MVKIKQFLVYSFLVVINMAVKIKQFKVVKIKQFLVVINMVLKIKQFFGCY